MARRRLTAEQIIGYLRQVEIKVAQGRSVDGVLCELGVVGSVYYRCCADQGDQTSQYVVVGSHTNMVRAC